MSLGELGCPSLEYVYNMSWAEFLIRLYAYKREQLRLDYRQREIMYQIYTSNWFGPQSKGKPVTKNKYWDIDGSERRAKIRRMNKLYKAQLEYQNRKR